VARPPPCTGGRVLVENERLNLLTRAILGAAIEVHRVLGPGLLESVYLACLQHELSLSNLRFVVQQPVPIVYKGVTMQAAHRIDLLVEDMVIVEVKSVDGLAPVHNAQLLTYVRLTDRPAGLLINFNVPRLMLGVKRVLNTPGARRQRGDGGGHG
jgi:GxxExxY protein